jgi:hypothetical protein
MTCSVVISPIPEEVAGTDAHTDTPDHEVTSIMSGRDKSKPKNFSSLEILKKRKSKQRRNQENIISPNREEQQEIIRKNQIEILELKSTITEMKIHYSRFKCEG